MHDQLRRACRIAAGRTPEPTAAVIDSQSVKAAETVAAASRGPDAGKKVQGRKRHIAVDVIGLLLTVLITAASVQDRDAARPLLWNLRKAFPKVRLAWADGIYAGKLVPWAATALKLTLHIVQAVPSPRVGVEESCVEPLEPVLNGRLIVRGSPDHHRLAPSFNARFDDRLPEAIALCESEEDVAAALSFLRSSGVESATRCAGHCFAGRSSTPGLLVDVSPMRSVSVAGGLATVGAGARIGEVYDGLLPRGLTIPGGTCPSVGIAGFTLGGGLGMLGRAHGLASDRLAGARIVLADGRIVDCDADHEADLFWALRGAGAGHFGVITALSFRTLPSPPVATTFNLFWPFAHARAVIRAWVGWAGAAPDEIAASLDLRASENLDERPTVEVFGTMLGSRSDATAVLWELAARAGADPESSDIREGSYRDMLEHWAERSGERMEEPRARPPRRYEVIKSEFFALPLPEEAVAAIVHNLVSDRVANQSREVDFSPWGGAYNRVPIDATAFVHRGPLYWLKHTAAVGTQASADERGLAYHWTNRSWQAGRPWGTGGVFPNFADPDLEDWGRAYYGSNYERLLNIKARYDPQNLFRFRQSLPVA